MLVGVTHDPALTDQPIKTFGNSELYIFSTIVRIGGSGAAIKLVHESVQRKIAIDRVVTALAITRTIPAS